MISPAVCHWLTMTHEQPVFWQALCFCIPYPERFQLQPKSCFHAICMDFLHYFTKSPRISVKALLKCPKSILPVPCIIPPAIHYKDFATGLSRQLYIRSQPLCRGISHQAIHIIVKNNRQLFYNLSFSAICRKCLKSFLRLTMIKSCHCRHCSKRLSKSQFFLPESAFHSRA